MDIHAMKRAAKKASRANDTSYGAELNTQAKIHGFTHWGALIAAQPKPSLGYRYFPDERTNANDFENARRDGNHIVYAAKEIEYAVTHVISMANTITRLPEKEIAAARKIIAGATAIAVLDEGLSRDWGNIRRITSAEISSMQPGSVIFCEAVTEARIKAAPKGVMLIGAVAGDDILKWRSKNDLPIQTLIFPTQDTSSINRKYSKEEQEIIYATTAIKYILPRDKEETIKLVENMPRPESTILVNEAVGRSRRGVVGFQDFFYPTKR